MKVILTGSVLLLTVSPCRAQTQTPANPTPSAPSSSSPSTPKSTEPAGGTPDEKKPVGSDKKKPKKVWTNDEIGSVGGTVSVVGDPTAKSDPATKTSALPPEGAKQKLAESYRSQIQQLQAQMDGIDKRIAQLRNFKGENSNPSGGINPNQGYNMVPLEDQVKQLEDRKKQLQGKIDDLESDAKKNGIEPGDLR
jgi:TolA-binding protein